MMTGIFSWLRTQVRDAFLGGVHDAISTLQEAQEPAQLLLEHREAKDTEDEPEPARNGRGKVKAEK